MNHGRLVTQVCAHCRNVVGVTGEHFEVEPGSNRNKMGVYDVRCGRSSQQLPNSGPVVERMHSQGLHEGRQPRLSRPVAPDLCNDRMRAVPSLVLGVRDEKGLRGGFAAFDRDQEAGVEYHNP